jgi:hypothetical protein
MACTGLVVTVNRWFEDQRSTVSVAMVPKAAAQTMSFAGVFIGWLLIGED